MNTQDKQIETIKKVIDWVASYDFEDMNELSRKVIVDKALKRIEPYLQPQPTNIAYFNLPSGIKEEELTKANIPQPKSLEGIKKKWFKKYGHIFLLYGGLDFLAEDTWQFISQQISNAEEKGFKKGLNTPHSTGKGYCCACDYDLAVIDRKVKEAEERERERITSQVPKRIEHSNRVKQIFENKRPFNKNERLAFKKGWNACIAKFWLSHKSTKGKTKDI